MESIVTPSPRRCVRAPPPDKFTVTVRKTFSRRDLPAPEPFRGSAWMSKVRRHINNRLSKSPSRHRRISALTELYEQYVPTPQTEKELDSFLLSVWGNDAAGPSFDTDFQTAREIEDLQIYYEKKLGELKKNHRVHLSRLAHLADTSCTAHDDDELMDAISEAKSKIKCFDRLRFSLKQQVAEAILELLPESLVLSKRLSPKAVSIMKRWFNQHEDYPYPTARQKAELAHSCAITVDRVSNWFIKQRARTNRRGRRVSRRKRRRRKSRRARKRGRAKPRGTKGSNKGRNKLVIRHVKTRRIAL